MFCGPSFAAAQGRPHTLGRLSLRQEEQNYSALALRKRMDNPAAPEVAPSHSSTLTCFCAHGPAAHCVARLGAGEAAAEVCRVDGRLELVGREGSQLERAVRLDAHQPLLRAARMVGRATSAQHGITWAHLAGGALLVQEVGALLGLLQLSLGVHSAPAGHDPLGVRPLLPFASFGHSLVHLLCVLLVSLGQLQLGGHSLQLPSAVNGGARRVGELDQRRRLDREGHQLAAGQPQSLRPACSRRHSLLLLLLSPQLKWAQVGPHLAPD